MIVVKKSLNESFLVTISMTIEKSKIKIIVNSFPIVKLTLIGLSNLRVSYFHAIHRFNKQSFFFFWETNTHTQGRGKEILTQKHITTPLKSHSQVQQTIDISQSMMNHYLWKIPISYFIQFLRYVSCLSIKYK